MLALYFFAGAPAFLLSIRREDNEETEKEEKGISGRPQCAALTAAILSLTECGRNLP